MAPPTQPPKAGNTQLTDTQLCLFFSVPTFMKGLQGCMWFGVGLVQREHGAGRPQAQLEILGAQKNNFWKPSLRISCCWDMMV